MILRTPAAESRKWQVLALLFFAGALNYADRTAISSLLPMLRADLALTDVGMAAIGSLFLWSYAATSPFAGMVADRFSRSRLVALSLAAWSLVTGLTGLITDSNQLFALRVLLGLSECLYLPAALALLADYHASDTRAKALAIHTAGLSFGMVAGATVSGYLGEHFGWRLAFFTLGAAGLLVSLVAFVWLRDAERSAEAAAEPEPVLRALKSLVRIPSYFVILGEAALVSISMWIFANWLPLYFRETYGLTLAAAGFSGTFASTIGVVSGNLLGGFLSDRFARSGRGRRLLAMGVFYFLSMPMLLIFLWHPPVTILGAAILLHGFVRALGSVNEIPLLCELLPPNRRSTAIGFMNASNTFIGGSGVLISGYLKGHYGLTGVFAALSGIVLLASLVSLAGYRWLLPRDLDRVSQSSEEAKILAER
jgi:predicted MFS family arabinose efflux permease